MDQIRTGSLIRRLRLEQGMTQLALAERLGVSDKAISKWERGCGAPDLSILPLLSQALEVDTDTLLRGDLEANDLTNGNLKHMRFYLCPECGNLLLSQENADISCCGRRLSPLEPQKTDPAHLLHTERNDGEWYITTAHCMHREHYISFVALLSGDTLILKKRYPEWTLETRLPYLPQSTLLWYCTQHGLFSQRL